MTVGCCLRVVNATLKPANGKNVKELEKHRMASKLHVAPRANRKPRNTKTAPTLEQIQVRAYEIFLERRGTPGSQIEDWLQAERELLEGGPTKPRKSTRAPKSKAA